MPVSSSRVSVSEYNRVRADFREDSHQHQTTVRLGHHIDFEEACVLLCLSMKTNKLFLLWIAFLVGGVVQANATTLADIAGIYEGWRTETTASGTIRYEERDEILPDGSFYTTLVDENGFVYALYSVLTLDADGNIAGPYAGILEIHGRNLSINYRVDAHNAVHASAHQTD